MQRKILEITVNNVAHDHGDLHPETCLLFIPNSWTRPIDAPLYDSLICRPENRGMVRSCASW
jgi:hypothetical protein